MSAQPALYLPTMTLLGARVSEEQDLLQKEREQGNKDTKSLTESYLSTKPASPDGIGNLPLRTKPVTTLRRS